MEVLDNVFFNSYQREIVATVVVLLFSLLIRFVISTLVGYYLLSLLLTESGKKSGFSKPRIRLVLKYIDFLISIFIILTLVPVWGVERKQAFFVISSIFTVIGVAMFAQWSILSNITAGIIIFFSFPFRIGDKIKILDKDVPIEAEIIDIRLLYTLLKTDSGERISYPNNLFLQKGTAIVNKN